METTTSLPSVKNRRSQPATPGRAPRAGNGSVSASRLRQSSSRRSPRTTTARVATLPRPCSLSGPLQATLVVATNRRASARRQPQRASRATTPHRRASRSAALTSLKLQHEQRTATPLTDDEDTSERRRARGRKALNRSRKPAIGGRSGAGGRAGAVPLLLCALGVPGGRQVVTTTLAGTGRACVASKVHVEGCDRRGECRARGLWVRGC